MSCSKFHSAILFTLLLCIRVISFRFSIPYELLFSHSNARLRHSIFYFLSSRIILSTSYKSFALWSESINSGASWFLALTFCVSRISSTALLTMALFSCCLLIFFLGKGLIPRSWVGLILAYLSPNSPRTLHSSEECKGPCMRQIFDFPVGLSTCLFLRFPALSPFSGWVHNEADSPLFCLLWLAQLEYLQVCFYRKVLIYLHK